MERGRGGSVTIRPTDRELEVLRLVANGLTNAEIAKRLWIAERTVKYHLDGLRGKLHARDRAHLVALAFRAGLLVADCLDGQVESSQKPLE